MNQTISSILATMLVLAISGLQSANASTVTNPNELAGLALWLDAGAGTSTSGSGGSTTFTWADQSSAGNDVSRTGSAAGTPTVVPGAINGKPSVSFGGGLLSTSSLQLDATTTAFFVISPDSLPANANQRFFGHYPNGQFRFNNGLASGYFGANTDLTTPPATAGQFQILTYRLDSSVQIGINNPNLTATLGTSPPISTDVLTVGGVTGTSFSGDFAEIVVYDRALDNTEIALIGTYLADKYALDTAFPAPPAPVAEPTTSALLSLGFLALAYCRRRKSRS